MRYKRKTVNQKIQNSKLTLVTFRSGVGVEGWVFKFLIKCHWFIDHFGLFLLFVVVDVIVFCLFTCHVSSLYIYIYICRYVYNIYNIYVYMKIYIIPGFARGSFQFSSFHPSVCLFVSLSVCLSVIPFPQDWFRTFS